MVKVFFWTSSTRRKSWQRGKRLGLQAFKIQLVNGADKILKGFPWGDHIKTVPQSVVLMRDHRYYLN